MRMFIWLPEIIYGIIINTIIVLEKQHFPLSDLLKVIDTTDIQKSWKFHSNNLIRIIE